MEKYFILILFAKYFSLAYGQCQLADETKNEQRIVALNINDRLEPLNEEKVASGTTLYYICTNDDVIEVQCSNDGQFSRTLPVNECDNPMAAVVEKVSDNGCSADTYRIGYPYKDGFLELYRNCYDTGKMRALYSIYTARAFTLTTKRPGNWFTTDDIVTQADAESFKPQNILARFKELFGDDQTYADSNLNKILINRGHLTPSGDFLFFNNARATFKLVNIMPQFQKINGANWRKIEDWVKETVVSNGPATVRTGAFGLLQLPKGDQNEMVPVYLQQNERNPVPEWTYKIIKNSQGATVFLVYNNVFNRQSPDTSELCQKVDCPISLSRNREKGITVCCEPEHFENTVLPKFQ